MIQEKTNVVYWNYTLTVYWNYIGREFNKFVSNYTTDNWPQYRNPQTTFYAQYISPLYQIIGQHIPWGKLSLTKLISRYVQHIILRN